MKIFTRIQGSKLGLKAVSLFFVIQSVCFVQASQIDQKVVFEYPPDTNNEITEPQKSEKDLALELLDTVFQELVDNKEWLLAAKNEPFYNSLVEVADNISPITIEQIKSQAKRSYLSLREQEFMNLYKQDPENAQNIIREDIKKFITPAFQRDFLKVLEPAFQNQQTGQDAIDNFIYLENRNGVVSNYPIPYLDVVYDLYLYPSTDKKVKALEEFIVADQIKRIGLNIKSTPREMVLGVAELVQKYNLDVHVTGFCFMACAQYILPAARTVEIGSYGMIGYGDTAAYRNQVNNIAIQEGIGILKRQVQAKGKNLEPIKQVLPLNYLCAISMVYQRYQQIFDSLTNFGLDCRTLANTEITPQEVDKQYGNYEFLNSMSAHSQNLVYEMILLSYASQALNNVLPLDLMFYTDSLQQIVERETAFFNNLRRPKINSRTIDTYAKFMNGISPFWSPEPRLSLTEVIYTNYRINDRFSKTPEVRKNLIVPSENLLKQLGVNVIAGANNARTLYPRNIFYLESLESIQKHRLFNNKNRSSQALQSYSYNSNGLD